jgi:hypothetical protein
VKLNRIVNETGSSIIIRDFLIDSKKKKKKEKKKKEEFFSPSQVGYHAEC